jgi:simple sugar transport system ATP-binding protein
LELRKGEIHSLVGENGAGKSTLMHVAAGLVRPTAGNLRLDGKTVSFASPREATARGVAMVFQNFLLVEEMTVADNVMLGLGRLPAILDRKAVASRLAEMCDKLGFDVDPGARVSTLAAGQKQKAALLRALYREARILVLDEPTAVLTPDEADHLLRAMRRLAAEGISLLFVSHKLPEIMSVSDRISVMHKGRMEAAGRPASSVSAEQVAAMMVGERGVRPEADGTSTSGLTALPGAGGRGPACALLLDHVGVVDSGVTKLHACSLNVAPGEIVGVAGISGNGQRELAAVCAGVLPPSSGRVVVGGSDLTGCGARRFLAAGVSYVPEDRYHEGSAGPLSLLESCALKEYRRLVRGPMHLLDRRALRAHASAIVESFSIQASGVEAATASLSGGNLQKLILGREISRGPRLLVIHQPTQGLDLASCRFVAERIERLAEDGCAVLLLSSDLDEILHLSTRVLVMYRGRIAGSFEGGRIDRRSIGRAMAGLPAPPAPSVAPERPGGHA